MAEHIYRFRVLLISPGDVLAERDAVTTVANRWNAQIGDALGAHVEIVRWETHGVPDMSAPAQDVLNRQIVNTCDFGLAIFWSKLGTPTAGHQSGSVEEIEKLRAQGKRVMLYFCDRPLPAGAVSAESERLGEVRSRYERESFFGTYTEPSDLMLSVSFHITSAVKELLPGRADVGASPSALAQALAADAVAPSIANRSADTVPLRGRTELYGEITKLIQSTEGALHIRATSLLALRDRAFDATFNAYIRALAVRIAAIRAGGNAASYSLVMGFTLLDDGAIPNDRRRAIRERSEAFKVAGVADAITVFHTPHQWLLDVLTINDQFAIIGFPGAAGDPHLRYALRVAGQQFASQFTQWFDTCVLPSASLVDLRKLSIKR